MSPLIGKRATSDRPHHPTYTGVVVFMGIEGGGYLDSDNGFSLDAYAYLMCESGEIRQVPLAGLVVLE